MPLRAVSAAMIAETARKGIYDSLQKAELVAALNTRRADADLVTAADVFIYCGALPPVLAALVPALKPGGLVAFSLEAHDGPEPLFLRPSLRYAHGVDATRDALVVAARRSNSPPPMTARTAATWRPSG